MFLHLSGALEARDVLLSACRTVGRTEILRLEDAAGRVLASDVTSPEDLPAFNRAAMDGYAVCSKDTIGAGPANPVYLDLCEGPYDCSGRCVAVRTGSVLPGGFDAVLMLEDTSRTGSQVEVRASMHPFKNVSRTGEDVRSGDLVLLAGQILRPAGLALAAALGITRVDVLSRPNVVIIPTGSELVPASTNRLPAGAAREVNGLLSRLYVEIWGAKAFVSNIVADDPGLIRGAIQDCLDADLILISGGTSVGDRDFAPGVVEEMGRLLVHGVRMTPGKPTAVGVVGDVPVVCLPGYPVAALSALYILVRPAVKRLSGMHDTPQSVRCRLTDKIVSRPGYLTFARVSLGKGGATPIMTTGAGILSSASRADGFVVVSEQSEGLQADQEVEVTLFE